jgi:hypothetical protein
MTRFRGIRCQRCQAPPALPSAARYRASTTLSVSYGKRNRLIRSLAFLRDLGVLRGDTFRLMVQRYEKGCSLCGAPETLSFSVGI